jgi:hypothetical protein
MIPKFICDLCYKGPNQRDICGLNRDYYNPFQCNECDINGVSIEINTEDDYLYFFYSDKKLRLSEVEKDSSLLFDLIKEEINSMIF